MQASSIPAKVAFIVTPIITEISFEYAGQTTADEYRQKSRRRLLKRQQEGTVHEITFITESSTQKLDNPK